MKDKIVVITGGNDGIGFATAKALAIKGATIILLSRNLDKAEKAVEEIKQVCHHQQVSFIHIDLLSFSSVRKAAEELHRVTDRIDVLINNAGGTFSTFGLNENGIERTLVNNHFSHFLLTGLLFDLLQRSEEARIINVSSHAHVDFKAVLDIETMNDPSNYFVFRQYAISKLMNVLFSNHLTKKLKEAGIKNVTANSLHPGTVRTQIGAKPGMSRLHKMGWMLMSRLSGISLENGARTSIYLASHPDVKGLSGLYFSSVNRFNIPWKDTRKVEPSVEAMKGDKQQALWDYSVKVCEIDFP